MCYCLGCTVALLNARESPRATKTPSRGSCAGSTHTRSGLARRFGNSTFPTIRFPLAAILTVSFVSTIQNSDYLRPISCVCCLHSFSRVPSPLLTLERSFDRDGRFWCKYCQCWAVSPSALPFPLSPRGRVRNRERA